MGLDPDNVEYYQTVLTSEEESLIMDYRVQAQSIDCGEPADYFTDEFGIGIVDDAPFATSRFAKESVMMSGFAMANAR